MPTPPHRSLLSRLVDPFLATLGQTGAMLVIVFSLLSILCSNNEMALTQLDLDHSTSYCAPDNLRHAAESFRLALNAESPQADTALLKKSQAWQKLETNLGAYADKLELYRSQSNRLRTIMSWASLGGAFLMLIGTFLSRHLNVTVERHHPAKSFDDPHL